MQPLPKVFSPEFLELVQNLDCSLTAGDAERARPLSIDRTEDGRFEVRQVGSRNEPLARFTHRELAVLYRSAYPTVDREDSMRLGERAENGWHPMHWRPGPHLEMGGELRHYDCETVEAMQSLLALARNPELLSCLFEFVGSRAIEAAGEILIARMQEEGRLQDWPGGS